MRRDYLRVNDPGREAIYRFTGKHRRTQAMEDPLLEMATPDPGNRRGQLLEMVHQLPVLDRQLTLLYLECLSAAEIEAVTGLTANNVAVRLSRIRRKLAAQFKPTVTNP